MLHHFTNPNPSYLHYPTKKNSLGTSDLSKRILLVLNLIR